MLASTVLRKLQWEWKEADVSLRTKLRLVKARVYPVLLYAAEVWTSRKQIKTSLKHLKCAAIGRFSISMISHGKPIFAMMKASQEYLESSVLLDTSSLA